MTKRKPLTDKTQRPPNPLSNLRSNQFADRKKKADKSACRINQTPTHKHERHA